MATTAQCLYCFDVLTANLEKRSRLTLAQCEELWAKYQASQGNHKPGEASDDGADIDGDNEPRAPLPRGVARLQVDTPASGSGGSTPSTASASSSSTGLSSAASKTSSKSSLFSSRREPEAKEAEYPVFVTWNETNSRGSKSLRGCVGTFQAAPLSHNLESYAITSYVASVASRASLYMGLAY